eukprot:9483401-Pyramimonas_sp.AAC.1
MAAAAQLAGAVSPGAAFSAAAQPAWAASSGAAQLAAATCDGTWCHSMGIFHWLLISISSGHSAGAAGGAGTG